MKMFGYEIIISKIQRKKKTDGYRARRWTEEDDISLAEMYSRNLQHKTMASRLNRTIPAIHGRLHILKERQNAKN